MTDDARVKRIAKSMAEGWSVISIVEGQFLIAALLASETARQEAEAKRDDYRAELQRYSQALILAWGGVCPLYWAMDPSNPALMAETIRSRGDALQGQITALEAKLEAAETRARDADHLLARACAYLVSDGSQIRIWNDINRHLGHTDLLKAERSEP